MTIHSDQGFQYQNFEYVSRLKTNRVFQSMSRKATRLDNATAESILKVVTGTQQAVKNKTRRKSSSSIPKSFRSVNRLNVTPFFWFISIAFVILN